MALHYILDGYNIVKQISYLDFKDLRGSRERLIKFVEIHRPQGSTRNKVTIVFDGKTGISQRKESSIAKIVYSQNESADETIKRMVSYSKRKKETVVVTDDKELRFLVRASGGKVCSVKDFLAKAGIEPSSGKRKLKKPRELDKKTISKSLEYKINDEMKKIWL